MRWPIIRLIWFRELRDQLRDRRTVFMIVALPLLLYPILGFGVLQFALGMGHKAQAIGVYGLEHLPPEGKSPPPTPAQAAYWVGSIHPAYGLPGLMGASAHSCLDAQRRGRGIPPLVVFHEEAPRFASYLFDYPQEVDSLILRPLKHPEDLPPSAWPEGLDRRPLEDKDVDLLLIIPPDFCDRLAREERPAITLLTREGDDHSRLVNARTHTILALWKKRLKELRLLRRGLPLNYDEAFEINNPERAKPPAAKMAEGLFEMLVRLFPFMLVMWSLAGALYPAVDLCAGEKERGTMETLLISPVSREEIVWGKFLTIWVFSAATAVLNLASMAISTWQFGGVLPEEVLRPAPLLWSVLLLLPLSAFFSALSLAIGAYARSTKEGQHYLMPLFLICMPLIFLTLAPGVELNPFYSMVPVTGVALLLQRLMTSQPDQIPWIYFGPVLGPLLVYGWLALRWAIEQFRREEVLFREAERLDLGLWLRGMLRDKENLPSAGQALFCFALILVLRFLTMGFGPTLGVLISSGIGLIAFLLAPPLFMALLLTKKPLASLALKLPRKTHVIAGAALAVLLLFPLLELTQWVLQQYPELKELLKMNQPLAMELQKLQAAPSLDLPSFLSILGIYLLLLGVLPAVCEELAFRGFIQTGLLNRFRPHVAILMSSFLFALNHMNVFQFLPALVLGGILGILAWRSGSVIPGMVFHLLHNCLLIGLTAGSSFLGRPTTLPASPPVGFFVEALSLILASLVLWRILRPEPDKSSSLEGSKVPLAMENGS